MSSGLRRRTFVQKIFWGLEHSEALTEGAGVWGLEEEEASDLSIGRWALDAAAEGLR